MNFRVEGLDAAVKHLREAGEIGDIANGEACFTQDPGGAASGDELDRMLVEATGEVDEAGFIGDGEQGATDWLEVGGRVLMGVSDAFNVHR